MNDYISRQTAIDVVNHMRFGMERLSFEIVTHKLLEMPAADVRENVSGEWVGADLDKDFVTCSVCKNSGYKDRMALRPDYAKKYFNFCPNCGADMRNKER